MATSGVYTVLYEIFLKWIDKTRQRASLMIYANMILMRICAQFHHYCQSTKHMRATRRVANYVFFAHAAAMKLAKSG